MPGEHNSSSRAGFEVPLSAPGLRICTWCEQINLNSLLNEAGPHHHFDLIPAWARDDVYMDILNFSSPDPDCGYKFCRFFSSIRINISNYAPIASNKSTKPKHTITDGCHVLVQVSERDFHALLGENAQGFGRILTPGTMRRILFVMYSAHGKPDDMKALMSKRPPSPDQLRDALADQKVYKVTPLDTPMKPSTFRVDFDRVIDFLSVPHLCDLPRSRSWADNFMGAVPGFKLVECSTRLVKGLEDCLTDCSSFWDLKYIALSYVWASSASSSRTDDYQLEDTSTAVKAAIDMIPSLWDSSTHSSVSFAWNVTQTAPANAQRLPTKIPKVVEDALSVAQKLGYRYLWVDRYCIPQDDPLQRHSQICNMDLIYARSDLTIIAAAGDGPDRGLPGANLTPRKIDLPNVRLGSYSVQAEPPLSWSVEEIRSSQWNTRGWTYQEAVLSPRRLTFTDAFTHFQCTCNMYGIEGISTTLPVFPSDTGGPPSDLNSFTQHARNFIARDLSFDTDAFNAFSGIQSSIERQKPELRFFCGLPVIARRLDKPTSLAWGLCWTFDGRIEGSGTVQRRQAMPSWTWLGWKIPSDADVAGPIWILYREANFLPFTDAVDWTIVFKNGVRQSWKDMTRDSLAALKLCQNEGAIGSLMARGWTFGLLDLLDGSSSLEICDNVGTVIDPQNPRKLLQMIEDWASVYRLSKDDVRDGAKSLCLVMGYTGGKSSSLLRDIILPVLSILVLACPAGHHSFQRLEIVRARAKLPWSILGRFGEKGWQKKEINIR